MNISSKKLAFLCFSIVLMAISIVSCHKPEEESEDYRNKWIGEYSYKALVTYDSVTDPEWDNILRVEKTGLTEVNLFIIEPWYNMERKFSFTVWPNGELHLINEFDTRRFVTGGFSSDSLIFNYRDVDIVTHSTIDYEFHCLKK